MRRVLAIATLTVLAAGCGGGGGGAATGSSAGVSIVGASPAKLEAQAYEGMSPPSVTFRVNFDGDQQTLNGKTLYVVFEVPDPLFEPHPSYRIDSVNKYVEITLQGRLSGGPLAQGVYANSMRIFACLDAACNSQLGNSPYSVPYKITMLPGLKLSPDTASFSTLFGAVPAPTRLSVQLPQGTSSWDLFANPSSPTLSVAKAADGSASIDVIPTLATPGVYAASYSIQATLPNPDNPGTSLILAKQLTISYTVQPNPDLTIAFNPSGAAYQLTLNDPQQKYAMVGMLSQEGTISRTGAVYLSAPAAAAGNPNASQWLNASLMGSAMNEYWVIPCGTNPTALTCLPIGTYTAVIRFKHSSGTGVQTDVDYPVQMTISP